MNPYEHKKDPVSPRQFQARETNAMEIIKNLASQVNPSQSMENIQQFTSQPGFGEPMDQPMQDFGIQPAPFQEPHLNDEALAFDEKGNFKKPPYEGFWADKLAEVDPGHPLLEHGKKIRSFLNEIDATVLRR